MPIPVIRKKVGKSVSSEIKETGRHICHMKSLQVKSKNEYK